MLYSTYPGSSIKIEKSLDFLLSFFFPFTLKNLSLPFPKWSMVVPCSCAKSYLANPLASYYIVL